MVKIAAKAGWKLEKETIITPELSLQDGRWEVGTVCDSVWEDEMNDSLEGEEMKGEMVNSARACITAARDATISAQDHLVQLEKAKRSDVGWNGNRSSLVATMDVWCAVFTK